VNHLLLIGLGWLFIASVSAYLLGVVAKRLKGDPR
jgi:hypothetical protein